MKKRKGFTLIELLVVIAIIGVLATIVLVSLSSARVKGRDAKRVGDLKQLQLALELYYDDNNQAYPTVDIFNEPIWTTLKDYAPAEPVDPLNSGSQIYKYCTDAAGSFYHLYIASLEDDAHSAYGSDYDYDSSTACTTGGINGADPVYDLKG